MGNPTSYAVADLSGRDKPLPTMTAWVDGLGNFEVVQFSMSYAINEIPKAVAMIAVGRDVRSPQAAKKAKVHEAGLEFTQMRKAKIWFEPRGKWSTAADDELWEAGSSERKVIFEGYFTGIAYKKIMDKVEPVLHFIHWSVDLGFSSTLNAEHHPSNPASYVHPAIFSVMQEGGGVASGNIAYITQYIGHEVIRNKVKEDLWAGIKEMLWLLANRQKIGISCLSACIKGPGNSKINTRAQRALEKIEGESKSGRLDYEYSEPLKMDTYIMKVHESVADAVTLNTLESFANMTFWDAIVNFYCPAFRLAFVPLVDRGLIVASCPAYNKSFWKRILPNEYDSFDLSALIPHPMQGVAILGAPEMVTGWGSSEPTKGEHLCIGGGFAADAPSPSTADGDGVWTVMTAPAWLRGVTHTSALGGTSSGVKDNHSNNTVSTPKAVKDAVEPTGGKIIQSGLCRLYADYAQSVFIDNVLRGRGATLSGKLRFDIAPGSLICVETSTEALQTGEDRLAVPLYAHVQRVTVNVNAEARLASTAFQLSHLRTNFENKDARTSIERHPLFADPIYTGSGLNTTGIIGKVDRSWEF